MPNNEMNSFPEREHKTGGEKGKSEECVLDLTAQAKFNDWSGFLPKTAGEEKPSISAEKLICGNSYTSSMSLAVWYSLSIENILGASSAIGSSRTKLTVE